jgi:hypothetical protein
MAATYRNLLTQELQVLLAVSQARLGSSQFLRKHGLGLVQRVREHDICTEPEVDFFHISWGDRGARVEGIVEFEVSFEVGIGVGLRKEKKVRYLEILLIPLPLSSGLRLHTSLRNFKNRTISNVFLISGIFSRSPVPRRWVLTSMN